jgi:membrane protein HdeD
MAGMNASPALRWLTVTLLAVAGLLAILTPFVSAVGVTIGLGAVAMVAGVGQLLRAIRDDQGGARWFQGLGGLLYLLGGLSLFVDPVVGTLGLTLLIGLLLLFQGVVELAAAAARPLPARGLVLADGLITALLGGLLVAEWPSDSLWVVGTFFGVTLLITATRLALAPGGAN